MDPTKEHWMLGRGSYCIDGDATVDDLLSDAAEWLECARCLTDFAVEAFRLTEIPDRRRLIFALTAVATLTHMGTQCAAHAHAHGMLNRDV